MDIQNAVTSAVKPDFLIKIVIALAIIALVNSLLPTNYKISRLFGGLSA